MRFFLAVCRTNFGRIKLPNKQHSNLNVISTHSHTDMHSLPLRMCGYNMLHMSTSEHSACSYNVHCTFTVCNASSIISEYKYNIMIKLVSKASRVAAQTRITLHKLTGNQIIHTNTSTHSLAFMHYDNNLTAISHTTHIPFAILCK